MQLTSPAFEHNGAIERKFTCQSDNVNPPLKISGAPVSTKSFALICDDPDAATDLDGPGHTFDHWVIWNIPPTTTEIRENSVPTGAVEGLNDQEENGYTGPCPPTDTHRYFFRLYALDTELDLPHESDSEDLEDAISGHVLAQTELIGTYQKS